VRNRNQASGFIEKVPSRSLKNSRNQTRKELKDRSYREVKKGETVPHVQKTIKAVDTIKNDGNTPKTNHLELPVSPKNYGYQWKDQKIKVEIEPASFKRKESKFGESLCLSMKSYHDDTNRPPQALIGTGSRRYSVLT